MDAVSRGRSTAPCSKFDEEPTSARRAMIAIIIAIATTVVIGGVAMWIVDRREYPDLGVAIWYVLQTVTTVGYGDVPPKEPIGRLVGGVIMVLAVAFLAMVTASITSTFFESRQQARRVQMRADEAEHRARLEAQFEQSAHPAGRHRAPARRALNGRPTPTLVILRG